MSGIAGIAKPGCLSKVIAMLEALAHRGWNGMNASEIEGVCVGSISAEGKLPAWEGMGKGVRDESGPGCFARALANSGRFKLSRDPFGVAPLYYGRTHDGAFCFASEVKALMVASDQVIEFPPGATFDGEQVHLPTPRIHQSPSNEPIKTIAAHLRTALNSAVGHCMNRSDIGAWLSGGIDSSALAALACSMTNKVHTFAGGLRDSPDLACAREVAEFLGTEHHEVVISFHDVLRAMPEVVSRLESFDAQVVRSGLISFLVARVTSDHVSGVLSGEGSDELFGGHICLAELPTDKQAAALDNLLANLHNTTLQRVDRSASAHGLTIHACFLAPEVVEVALQIPVGLKIRQGVEKWILRQACQKLLPVAVLERPKRRLWEGAGLDTLLSENAESRVSTRDFEREKRLPNGWELRSKEELIYYRLFRDTFPKLDDFSWMGRTQQTES